MIIKPQTVVLWLFTRPGETQFSSTYIFYWEDRKIGRRIKKVHLLFNSTVTGREGTQFWLVERERQGEKCVHVCVYRDNRSVYIKRPLPILKI